MRVRIDLREGNFVVQKDSSAHQLQSLCIPFPQTPQLISVQIPNKKSISSCLVLKPLQAGRAPRKATAAFELEKPIAQPT